MKKTLLAIFLLLSGWCVFAQSTMYCLIKTAIGEIEIELYPTKAPITVQNFLHYVDSGMYDNTKFFRTCTKENEADRTIQIEVIQAADIPEVECFPPILLETTKQTGILHKDGTISMARDKPVSATSSFFICINDQPELDFGGKRHPDGKGFAAFGKVTNGMDVVKEIQKRDSKNQFLEYPVEIYSIKRK